MTGLLEHLPRGAPPWWSQYVELTVELGIGRSNEGGATVGSWDRSRWSHPSSAPGVWSGLEPTWVQVDPCRLIDLQIERGRERWIDRYGSSSMTATIDDP